MISSDKHKDIGRIYYFIGDFEKENRLDYYGGEYRYIIFDPYKASEGKVKLFYQL